MKAISILLLLPGAILRTRTQSLQLWQLYTSDVVKIQNYFLGSVFGSVLVFYGLADFKRKFVTHAEKTIKEVYQQNGIKLHTRKAGKFTEILTDPEPGFWKSWRIHKEIITLVTEYFCQQVSEKAGVTQNEVKKRIRTALSYYWEHETDESAAMMMKLLEDTERKIRISSISRYYSFVTTERNCSTHFPNENYPQVIAMMPEFGRHAVELIHILICISARNKLYENLVQSGKLGNQEIYDGRNLTPRRLLRAPVFTVDDLQSLHGLVVTKELSSRFLEKCVVENGVVLEARGFVYLQQLIHGQLGTKITLEEVANLYFRGVQLEYIASLNELLACDWMSFNQARRAAQAGVIPELAVLFREHEAKPEVEQLIQLHVVVENVGINRVESLLAELGTTAKVLGFFSLRQQLNEDEFSDDQIIETLRLNGSVRDAKDLLLGIFAQKESQQVAPKTTTRQSTKRRTRVTNSTEQAVVLRSEDIEMEGWVNQKLFYKDIRVGQLPHLSSRDWLRRFQRCGWVLERTSGTHQRIRKGPWNLTLAFKGAGSWGLRYELWDNMRRAHVPEEEVFLLMSMN
jgi:hypothetical protein